jgi:hypothetical protein
MKKFMMKYLMLNCSEATMLMAKKEEDKLSLKGRIQLAMHVSMCSLCRKFEKQSHLIGEESKHVHSGEKLSADVKGRIIRMIEEQS